MDYEAANQHGRSSEHGNEVEHRPAALTVPPLTGAAGAGAQPLVAGADGVIVLPAGVELDDIKVQGRDLVIHTDDGRTYVIPDGAVFVPTLVLDGVTVPPLNLAALLNGLEIQPAAGGVQSSGGNFADPVGDIQDAYRLGDLLPYTEFGSDLAPRVELLPGFVNRDPDVTIITPNNPTGAASATATVQEKGLPPHNGLPAGSGEGADGNPNNNSDTTETTSGTIVFQSPDGVQAITLNGTAVTQVGQVVNGSFGTLTITSIDLVGGTIGFTYTQTTNTAGDNTHDDFAVQVTDPQGDTATATLAVNIIDDVPDAISDADAVAAGSNGPATGNVLTGSEVAVAEDANASDGVADVQGADGARISFIDNSQNAAPGTAVPAGGSTSIAGQFGTLTIFANGDYSYARNPGQGGGQSEVFTYTLLDGDGDSDTATLTIAIGDSAPAITGLTPEANGGDTVVDEDDLPAGSDPAPKDSLTGTGDFTITSPDGVGSLVIGGHQVITNGVFTPETWTTPLGNTIAITGYNPATGVVSYSYTLTAAESHASANGENNLFENFSVQLTDLDGDAAASTLSVRIVDDVPDAIADTDTVAAGSNGPATGNVITGSEVSVAEDANASDGAADVQGADGARVSFVDNTLNGAPGAAVPSGGSTTIAGQFGTLTIFANGDYSYARNPGQGGGQSEVFSYTLLDADGDSDTTTLTIAIADSIPLISNLTPEAQGGDVVVDEDDLLDGSDTSKESLTGQGDFTIASPDGVATLVIDGHTVITGGVFTPASWTTPLGNTLSITGFNAGTGVVTYTYTLGDNENHPTANGENDLFESFAVQVTDNDGDPASGTLVARIVDDVPTGVNDTDSVAAGTTGPATGNVLTGVEVTVAEDGNATDGTADIQGADGARVSFIDNTLNGTPGAAVASGGFTDIAGQFGTLRIWSNGDYSYTRTPGAGGGGNEVFQYTLLDGDGDTATATLTISIGNSPPVIRGLTPSAQGGDVVVDEDDLQDGSDTSKESLTGTGDFTISSPDGIASLVIGGHTVITNGVFTPDSWTTPLGNTISITAYNAATGVVSYSYTLLDNENHLPTGDNGQNDLFENFTVVLTDTDGQAANDTLVARIVDDVPTAADDTDAVTAGTTGPATGNVLTGSEVAVAEDANASDGVADVQGADGARISFIDNSQNAAAGVAVPNGGSVNIAGQFGTLTIYANGDYSYARNPGQGGGQNEVFTYTLLDGDGDTDTATLTIAIGDSTPSISDLNVRGGDVTVDEDDLADGSDPAPKDSLTGNGDFTITSPDGVGSLTIGGHQVITNGVFTADSWTTPLGNTLSITGYDPLTGVVTYTYTLTDNENHLGGNNGENDLFESFAVQLVDLDGDPASDTLVARIVDDVPTAVNDGVPTPYTAAENTPLVIDVLANDIKGADGVDPATGMVSFTQPTAGQGTVAYNNDGTFTFTPPNNGFFGNTSFTYTIKDGDGDESTATVFVEVARDSVPQVGTPANVVVDEDGFTGVPVTGNVDAGRPGEIDSNELRINTGTVVVGFGGDKPAAPLANIDFINFTTLNGLLSTVNGAVNFTHAAGSPASIVGNDGVNDVIVISFTAVANTANPGEVQYTYQVELKQPILQAPGGGETGIVLSGVQFQVTDSDGSTGTGQFNVTIVDDIPVNNTASLTALAVHEDALNTAGAVGNSEGGQTASGSFAVSSIASLVAAGADAPVTIGFDSAIDGVATGLKLGGVSIVWDYIDATHVEGKAGGTTVFTLTRNGSNYDFVLKDNIDHDADANLATGEGDAYKATLNLAGVFTATDQDGDKVTINHGISVTIENDVPRLNTTSYTLSEVHEDALPGGNAEGGQTTTATILTASLQGLVSAGADAPVTISLNAALTGATGLTQDGTAINWHYVSATQIDGIVGNDATKVVFSITQSGGNWTFTLKDNIDHGTLTDNNGDNFDATLSLANVFVATDTDGDKVLISGGITIDIENDVPANNAATTTVTVHEDALNNANAKGNNEGGKTVNASFTAASIAALVAAGADTPVVLAFNSTTLDGTATGLTQNGTSIDWDYVSATQVRGLVGGDASKVAFTLTWNAGTQSYDFVLLDNVDHGTLTDDNGDAYTTSLDLANVFTATDSDGDMIAIDAGASVAIENDIPTLGVVQSQQASNDPAQTPAVGTLHFSPGADGLGTITVTADLTGITSGGHTLTTQMTGSVLTAFYDADNSGTFNAGDTEVFTLTVNPSAGTSGQYVFDLKAPLDGSIVDTSVGGTTSFGAGPQPYQYLSQTSVATDPLALISGWQTNASFNAATWYAGSNSLPVTGVVLADVNGSTAGWGVDNNNFTSGELLRFDFGTFNDFDGAGAYNPPAPAVALPNISYAKFDMIGMGGGDTVQFVVHNTDGTTSHQTWTSADVATGYQVSAAPGKTIAWIDALSHASGGAKIDLQNVGVQSTVVDSTIPFTLTIKDGDGDAASQPFSVHVKDGLTPDAPIPPIVLDLDRDGVEFVSIAAGHTYDYLGDGHAVATAWAGDDDGILAIDLDGDGAVSGTSEFVFGGNGLTDLQGLAASYDSNHDNVLDAADARFAEFGVWKGDGSFQSLGDAGITSLSLVSDGASYTAANGDVTVHGTTTYTMADGTTGTAADATFAVSDAQVMDALLSANAPQNGAPPPPSAPADAVQAAVLDALGDANAVKAIDAVVDHFAANDVGGSSAAGTTPPPAEPADLQALLHASVAAAVDNIPPPMAMPHMDDHAAALAAAAA